LLGLFLTPAFLHAQDEVNDDLGDATDEFQEHFFEALKQKGIENYEKAIAALRICKKLNADLAIIDFEIGKNHLLLKNYDAAEKNILLSLKQEPNNEWYLESLYEVYYQTQNYPSAIQTAKKLVEFHPIYREDLLTLYMRTGKYKDALAIINQIDATDGQSDKRDSIRAQLFTLRDFGNEEVVYLKRRIEANPKNEKNYLALIYLLSEKKEIDQAFEIAKKLQKAIPKSKLAHLGLFRYYLRDKEVDKAINSMKIVLKASSIDNDSKFKVLNEFMLFTKDHPEHEEVLETSVKLFAEMEGSNTIFKELGNYYLSIKQNEKAAKYLGMVVDDNVNDFDSLRKTLFLYAEAGEYEKLYSVSSQAIESYPSQAILYLLNGAALNNLERYEEAAEILENGTDYVIDNIPIEAGIYKELIIAYTALSNNKRLNFYEKQLIKLNKLN
jgi:tetratricopeptide (TPR) repeat protein